MADGWQAFSGGGVRGTDRHGDREQFGPGRTVKEIKRLGEGE
jgi:hypothetical protein